MSIEKLPSGSYRFKKMVHGKLIRHTFDHKPDDLEISLLIVEQSKAITLSDKIFYQAALEYIKSKENVLSPTTIKAYNSIVKNMSEDFKLLKLSDISNITVQKEVNDYSVNHSYKSTKNYYGFISSVLALFCPDLSLRITLPPKEVKRYIMPSNDDIKVLLKAVKGTKYSIPFQLGILGLRRSEVCALSIDDLNGNILTINKSKVKDLNNQWIIKPFTKTTDSTREILIPEPLADEIREKGYIYNGSPDTLGNKLRRIQRKEGLPLFPLHSLRHYFVSYCHFKGIPMSYVQKMGGWAKSSDVMRRVYQDTLEDEDIKMQKKIGAILL